MNTFRNWALLYLGMIIFFFSCSQKEKMADLNKFKDPLLLQLLQLEYAKNKEEILPYLESERAEIQAFSLQALSSIGDSNDIASVAKFLKDKTPKVRQSAAYALGQYRNEKAQEYLINALDVEDSLVVRKTLYQALGKCVDSVHYSYLFSRVPNSDYEKQGMLWGMYNAGMRGVVTDTAARFAIQMLNLSEHYETRLSAAHFLSRARKLNLENSDFSKLKNAAIKDPAANVRMAVTSSLRHFNSDKSKNTLLHILEEDEDYRVKISALRALNSQEFESIEPILWEQFDSNNALLQLQLANLIDRKSQVDDSDELLKIFNKHPNWRVSTLLAGTYLRLNPKVTEAYDTIQKISEKEKNPYAKAEYLKLLSQSEEHIPYLISTYKETETPIIRTTIVQASLNILEKEALSSVLETTVLAFIKEAFTTNDPAITAFVAGYIEKNNAQLENKSDWLSTLKNAKKNLNYPKDLETFQAIDNAIASLDSNFIKEEYPPKLLEVNWDTLSNIPSRQEVKILTSEGTIRVELMVNTAPVSVYNFIKLAQSNYYDSVQFHRVVPNFVIQAGCQRGDGFGNVDHTIRTEVPELRYQEGFLGMASAGKDTEGAQWFITHSPTPHLSGRYTIFGRVTEGMDVVHKINVGSSIIDIEIK